MGARNGPEITGAVSDILAEDYGQDFDPIYEVTVRATRDTLPSQPINEIRNFATHLANALTEPDPIEVQLELARAMRHLRLATYDALVITLLAQEDYLLAFLNGIEKSKGSHPEFRKQVETIAQERREIPRIEPNTESDMETIAADVNRTTTANELLEKVITRCNELAKVLEAKFGESIVVIAGAASKVMHAIRQRHAVKTVWAYTSALFVFLAALEVVILRSGQMLVAIGAICFGGALLGTYIALTAPDGDHTQSPRPL